MLPKELQTGGAQKEEQEHGPATTRRTIRSYVLRTGRSTAAQLRALDELWPLYGVEFTPRRLDMDELFGRSAARMIEIGFGAGEALLAFASTHPEMDCIGIEVHRPGIGHLLLRIHEAGLTNLRIICHDAVEVLRQQIPPASTALVHIFFPDPWHKKRHHKRRLIQPQFMDVLAAAMASTSTLRLATDWEHYAHHMRSVIDAHPDFRNAGATTGFMPRSQERPLTRFERRGQRLGHDVWDLEYLRR